MTQISGNLPETRTPTSSSVNPISMACKPVRAKLTNITNQSTPKEKLLSNLNNPRHKCPSRMKCLKPKKQKIWMKMESALTISRWWWSTPSAPRRKPSRPWGKLKTTQSTPSWSWPNDSVPLLSIHIHQSSSQACHLARTHRSWGFLCSLANGFVPCFHFILFHVWVHLCAWLNRHLIDLATLFHYPETLSSYPDNLAMYCSDWSTSAACPVVILNISAINFR